MKNLRLLGVLILSCALLFSSCGASNTTKGTGIGAGAGALVGAGIGALIGGGKGAAWGAGAGALVGGGAGAIIGNKMDKQKAELEKINGAQVESINDGQAIKVTFESGILFATNSSTLTSVSQSALSSFAQTLVNYPDTDVEIYGHTDSSGTDKVNVPLSEKRAQSVYAFLVTKGVSGKRMSSQGLGSSLPAVVEKTAADKAQNRRVEVYILPNEKMINDAKQGK